MAGPRATRRPSWGSPSAPSTSPAAGSWHGCGLGSNSVGTRHPPSSARSNMAVRLNPCDPRRLRLLAEDRLPADEVPGLEEHLEHCADCRAALDDMTDGEPWMGAIREYLGPEPTGPFESGP